MSNWWPFLSVVLTWSRLTVGLQLVTPGRVTFYMNGGIYRETKDRHGVVHPETVGVTLAADETLYGATLPELVARLHALKSEHLRIEERLLGNISFYTAMGKQVNETSQLISGDYYILKPDEYLWMWPHVQPGHKVVFDMEDIAPAHTADGHERRNVTIESLNLLPNVFFIDNLLNEEEADDLIKSGEENVKRSMVGDSKAAAASPGRTSEGYFESDTEVSDRVIKRIYDILRIPYNPNSVDGMQIVRYFPGRFYNQHVDYLNPTEQGTVKNPLEHRLGGTNRYATVFFYLNDVPQGGQTGFPHASPLSTEDLESLSPELRPLVSSHLLEEFNMSQLEAVLAEQNVTDMAMQKGMANVCHSNLSVRPRRLGAVLFYNTDSELVFDDASLHTGCPVIEGVKWGANLWVWNGDKDGAPLEEINATFTNTFGELIDVYWVDPKGNEIHSGNIEPRETYRTQTFHSHKFRFKLAGTEVLLNTVVIRHANGLVQDLQIPVEWDVELTIKNLAKNHLIVYWVANDGSLVKQNDLAGNEECVINSYAGHKFEVWLEDGDRKVLVGTRELHFVSDVQEMTIHDIPEYFKDYDDMMKDKDAKNEAGLDSGGGDSGSGAADEAIHEEL